MFVNSNIMRRFVVSQIKCNVKVKNIRTVSTTRPQSFAEDNVEENKTPVFKGNYDIIIAGGGMVGCTLACALGK